MVIGLDEKRTRNYHARFCAAIDKSMNTNAGECPSLASQSHRAAVKLARIIFPAFFGLLHLH